MTEAERAEIRERFDFLLKHGGQTIYNDVLGDAIKVLDELQDIRDGERTILDEKCASDEVHCGCVPTLRKEIEKLREALGDAASSLAAIANTERVSKGSFRTYALNRAIVARAALDETKEVTGGV
jgi:hypothetical protein